ncbi:hypothetical protein CDD81_816 [Ophiocordyceps australis]|uniref:SRP9 domain-containing protein n=1 Tax=Ophiocordyceps australis TaxID=1399860 RepID=A0A2C5XFT9_9HYPO|nr:hypothetical protein CDD81_816 [Ophiocordyceps australis]
MPYFKSSQEWLDQSLLLLEARPSTTRVTTKYSVKRTKPSPSSADNAESSAVKPPRGSLVIKTYDPVSGVTLKYRTTKAAEVTRLVYSSLGRLGRSMAALPPDAPDESMPDAPVPDTAGQGEAAAQAQPKAQQQQQGGGGGKKKKKGRK